jgi:hypothetical protein
MRIISLADLAGLPIWVAWRVDYDQAGKPQKVPYRAQGAKGRDQRKPAGWGTRAEATARAEQLEKPHGGGIGIQLGQEIGDDLVLVGIDLDTCRDGSGTIAPWAREIVDRFRSYTEVSPSDTGYKIYFLMTRAARDALLVKIRALTGEPKKEGIKWARRGDDHPPAIELYLGGRYFTFTDRPSTGSGMRVVEAETIGWLIDEAGPAFKGNGIDDAGTDTKHRRDDSRSGDALGLARRVYRAGMSFEEFDQAVRTNPATAEWARTKGSERNNRQILRAWAKIIATPDDAAVSLDDFWAYMPNHDYIFAPTRAHWPAASVNARLPEMPLLNEDGTPVLDDKGEPVLLRAAAWLDRNKAVEQMIWAPGEPLIVEDRLLVDGGWIERPGAHCFNRYLPPTIVPGDPAKAGTWIDLVRYVYPANAEHIFDWFAHRVQRPHEKLNHALDLGGEPGIGKDTIIEPVKEAVGRWNFQEASPAQVLQPFNPYVKAVILRISEAHDLGEFDRFAFYDHTKTIIAAPPDVLSINEKYIRQYLILNVVGVIITTNHKTDGIYLEPDDRRHYVAWSDRTKEDECYQNDYWKKIWDWFDDGGVRHVTAWLIQRDLSRFDPKAPPPKTEAFWAIVNANRPSEEGELADALDHLKNPKAVTLNQICASDGIAFEIRNWLVDRKNRRMIPHRLEKCGYVAVRNSGANDGLWKIGGSRQVAYARKELSLRDQVAAVQELQRIWDIKMTKGAVEPMERDLLRDLMMEVGYFGAR